MPSVSLILISRVIASASSMSQALRVVSANLYTGIWPKKTPADAQVRGLLYRPVLPCVTSSLLSPGCPRQQESALLNLFDVFNMLHDAWCPHLHSGRTSVIFTQRLISTVSMWFCYLPRQPLDKCLSALCSYRPLSPAYSCTYYSNGIYYCTFIFYN